MSDLQWGNNSDKNRFQETEIVNFFLQHLLKDLLQQTMRERARALAASPSNVTVVLETPPNLFPELGTLKYHGWTAMSTRAAGYADDKLVQRMVWIARCSSNAPGLVPGSMLTGSKQLAAKNHGPHESCILRSCDMRFIGNESRKHVIQGPGRLFRLCLFDLGPNARELMLHLRDAWDFQMSEDESLVRSFARVRGKEGALQLIKASGSNRKGQLWFVDRVRWDTSPRMLRVDKLESDSQIAFARRVARDAGVYWYGQDRIQLDQFALRAKPDDERKRGGNAAVQHLT